LRRRRGWAQQQVADRAGVGRTAVVRWENGERLPSSEQMQALCFLLGAREEEFVALTAGRFSEPVPDPALQWDEKAAVLLWRRDQFSRGGISTPGELFYLSLEHHAWLLAAQHEQAKPVLAQILAFHAQELGNHKHWSEAGAIARRALALVPRQEQEPEWVLRAALMHAAAAVFAGHRIAPDRGISELGGWLPHSTTPAFSAWILSDLAQYTALAGQAQRGVEIAARALTVGAEGHNVADRALRLRDYGRLLMEAGRLEEALDHLPCTRAEDGDVFGHEALARAEIHARLGNVSASQDWLQRAYTALPHLNAEHLRPQLDALAHQVFGADHFLSA
jgi:transcriptional regulator with XRE-family HTH domain